MGKPLGFSVKFKCCPGWKTGRENNMGLDVMSEADMWCGKLGGTIETVKQEEYQLEIEFFHRCSCSGV